MDTDGTLMDTDGTAVWSVAYREFQCFNQADQ
jgi:hypothetical protein